MLFCYNIDRLGATSILLYNNVVQKYCPSRVRFRITVANTVVCPVEAAARRPEAAARRPEAAAAPNRFRPKPWVPSLVGHLPRVSYVCLVGQSLKGR